MGTYTPVAYSNVSPGSVGSWQTVDLSSLIPAGASGVALHFVNGGATDRECGWRKTGSTDNRQASLRNACQHYAYIGVDGSRQVDIYIGHADAVVWLVGYFDANVVFATNATLVHSGTTSGSWIDVDITAQVAGGDTAIAAIIEHVNINNQTTGYRKNGSTDARDQNQEHNGVIVGLDAGEIFEINTLSSTNAYLVGYVKSTATDATFHTNSTNRSLGSTGSYADLGALPAGAAAGLYEVTNSAGGNQWSIRKKGASQDHYKNANLRHVWALVECDGSQLVEGKIANTAADFFETGYFTQPAGITGSLAATESGSDTAAITGLVSVSGALAATETGSDTAAFAGDVVISGSMAAVETGDDVMDIQGTVPGPTEVVRRYGNLGFVLIDRGETDRNRRDDEAHLKRSLLQAFGLLEEEATAEQIAEVREIVAETQSDAGVELNELMRRTLLLERLLASVNAIEELRRQRDEDDAIAALLLAS